MSPYVERYDCCGLGPHVDSDLRAFTLSTGVDVPMCRACYVREMQHQVSERGAEYKPWSSAEVYENV